MSIVGKLNFLLGLQIKQCQDGILINQCMYVKQLMKKYKLDDANHASTPIVLNLELDLDPSGESALEKSIKV